MNIESRKCRICQKSRNENDLVSIFDRNAEIATKIFLLTGLKIIENVGSNYQALICTFCVEELNAATKFRRKCIKSEELLKEHRAQIESVLLTEKYNVGIKAEPESYNVDLFANFSEYLESIPRHVTENCYSNGQKIHKNKNSTIKEETAQEKQSENAAHCNLCFKTFSTIHSFKDHMRAIHQNLQESDMYKCSYCNRLFKMKYYLNRHIRNTHKKTPDKECKTKFIKHKSEDELFKEKLTGLNCPYCDKYLTTKHSLNDHIRVKHELVDFSDRFICDMCGKDFTLKYYLLRHIKIAHLRTLAYKKNEAENLPCSICGKIFRSKGILRTHERTHKVLTANEYWYCDLCGNKFKGKGDMSAHIKKRHLYKIKYPCEKCPGKAWRTLYQLQRHIKVYHNNIREFKCEWCGKEFGEKNKLICHTRIHTGEQPYHCSWENCDRKFTHQTDFRRHYWGHTGERPYKCEVVSCLKGFMKKSELIAHENRCHKLS